MIRLEQQGSTLSRYINYIEIFVIGGLSLLLLAQLIQLLGVDVWRQDSMYYVESYKDKLISEGRWINKLFFPFLRIIPAQICILLSYLCLGYFVYAVCNNISGNRKYALAVSLLCLNIPVLSVQLEWPETILFAFLFLPLTVSEAKKIPDYLYFPIFSILFFGTFSAFYFLLPLLFLRDINLAGAVRLLIIWCLSFLFGYLITNQLIHIITGQYIEIAGWRDPHSVKNAQDLWYNFLRIFGYFSAHMKSFYAVVNGAFFCVLFFSLFKLRSLNGALIFFIGICCALCIYITVIPLGIIVQERTSLSFWVAAIVALLVVRNIGGYSRLFLYLC